MEQTTAIQTVQPAQTAIAKPAGDEFAVKLGELWRLAGAAVKGGFAPRGLETQEKAFAAMAFGDELGFPPMASLRCIGVVNGKPGLYAEGILAVVHKSNTLAMHKESIEGEGEAMSAICTMQRVGRQAIPCKYSVADAKKAGLWGKQGPWQNSPKDMLMWKARHRAVKASFSDLIMGVECVEDLREIVTVSTPAATEPTPAPMEHMTATERLNAKLRGPDAPTTDPANEPIDANDANAINEEEAARIRAAELAESQR